MRAVTLGTLPALTLPGDGPRETVFLDKMFGLEKHIEDALAAQEVNAESIEEEEHPDLEALIGSRFKSLYAEVFYKKNTGRDEDTELKAVDVKTGRTLVVLQFRMGNEDLKKRAARRFVEMLEQKLAEAP